MSTQFMQTKKVLKCCFFSVNVIYIDQRVQYKFNSKFAWRLLIIMQAKIKDREKRCMYCTTNQLTIYTKAVLHCDHHDTFTDERCGVVVLDAASDKTTAM